MKKCLECGMEFEPVENGQDICDACMEKHTQEIIDEENENFVRKQRPRSPL